MARITSYPTVTPAAGDLVLLSDVSGTNNPTKTATASSLAALDPDNTLAEVLAAGNSATNNIVLTGDFTGSGNITRTGNITLTGAQTISTTLGVTGTTTLGVLSLSSISGGWTNAGNTIADLGTVTTADINGGNIDGTIIGATTDAAGTFTNLVTSTMDGIVGSVTPQAGTFTTLTATTSNLGALGSPVDCNNNEFTNVDIESGSIDGAIIGDNTPAKGTFTTITGSGN